MNRVTGINAHCLLHVYDGDPPVWSTKQRPLTPDQHSALAPPAHREAEPDAEPADLDEADRSLIAALADNARATYPQLAAATGLASSTAKRRLDRLLAEGIVLICTEFPAPPRLPPHVIPLASRGPGPPGPRRDRPHAYHTPISFAAAVTGPHNMVAAAITRNTSDLYRYLAEQVGPLPGVQYVETAPAMRQVKRLG